MRFKDFIKFSEEASGTDKGLMGFPVASSVRKPSDGQPFKNNGSVAGQTPRGNTGGAAGPGGPMPSMNAMFMKRRMKKN